MIFVGKCFLIPDAMLNLLNLISVCLLGCDNSIKSLSIVQWATCTLNNSEICFKKRPTWKIRDCSSLKWFGKNLMSGGVNDSTWNLPLQLSALKKINFIF